MMSENVEPQSPAELVQGQLKKLKLSLDAVIPYRWETVFAKISGWGAKGEMKRRVKLIQQAEPTLKQMLLPKEEVLYVAKGTQSSTTELLFMGAYWAAVLNQTVFVLTNLRILMLRSKSNGKPTHTFWVLYYSEIDLFQPTWLGALKLSLKDGKKFTFTGFPKLDRKAMPQIFQDALDHYRQLDFHPAVSQSRENLCNHCFQVVPKDRYVCRSCGSEFWRPKDLAIRSLIFPSWGDLCMGHYHFAVVEMIGYVFSWFVAIVNFTGPNPEEGIFVAGMIFIFAHPVDAMLTYGVAKKGLSPRRGPDPARALAEQSAGDNDAEEDLDDDEEDVNDVDADS